MRKLSPRLLALILGLLLVLAAPLALAALALARVALLPPAPNTRLIAFDGLHLDGACAASSTQPGQARLAECGWSAHLDSRFQILQRDAAAQALCRTLHAHYYDYYDPHWLSVRLGHARLGVLAPASSWWGGCGDVIPLQYGVYLDVWFDH
jgi:hypothetical protein